MHWVSTFKKIEQLLSEAQKAVSEHYQLFELLSEEDEKNYKHATSF